MKFEVNDIDIRVIDRGGEDYFSLTNMIKAGWKNLRVSDWLRTKGTIEKLVAWECGNNKNFNWGEFAAIMVWMRKPGSKNFKMGVKDWVKRTGATGLIASPGRYGGTYGHRDIAIDFADWVDPLN
ncbi:MAG TPA: KilA-N domain-containing protein [Puia sp.]|nr:KilA-N domain-containing protein [Puia sp.]